MRILSVYRGADTAGAGVGMARAFARHAPDWHYRSACANTNYIGYPPDMEWDAEAVAEEWEKADVVQLHDGFSTADHFEPVHGVKPYVVYHHGTMFRSDPDFRVGELYERHAIGLVSTLDLYLLAPNDVEWMPLAVDLERMALIRAEHYDPDEVIRICHAPTARDLKSTDAVVRAVQTLISEDFPIVLDLIEKVPWDECLRRKARADIFVDQVILGYGQNATEAWAMGMPVVAGASDETLDEMERRFGQLPFYHATEETITDAIRDLVQHPNLRASFGRAGLRHVERWHSPAWTVSQLQKVYERAAVGVAA